MRPVAEPARPLAASAPIAYASFDVDWRPDRYLAEYYTIVEADERKTIAFFVEAMAVAAPSRPILFFGVGPTLHHVFLAAPTASEIHLGDYLPGNLRAIERWLEGAPDAHDWRPFVRYTLEREGIARPTDEQVAAREALTRSKVTRLLHVDAREANPVRGGDPAYATVVSAYCADSATGDRARWASFMERIGGLVAPEGLLLTAALRRCRAYLVGGQPFPSADIDEDDLRAVLVDAFDCERGAMAVHDLPEHLAQGYGGIVLAWAPRRTLA